MLLVFCNLWIPLAMIGLGWWMASHPPGKINRFYGYRTNRSMKNMETWHFAQVYSGKLWFRMGIVILLVSLAVQIPFLHDAGMLSTLSLALVFCQLACLVFSIVIVEKALKKEFGD